MKEIQSEHDPIGSLVREEGLLSTSGDFTDRVMHRITMEESIVIPAYKPLLSRKSWMLIFSAAAMIVLICFAAFSGNTGNSADIIHKLNPLALLSGIIHVNPNPTVTGSLLLATLILDAIVLLLLMDYYLQKRWRKNLI